MMEAGAAMVKVRNLRWLMIASWLRDERESVAGFAAFAFAVYFVVSLNPIALAVVAVWFMWQAWWLIRNRGR
jgi:hypothetical protein